MLKPLDFDFPLMSELSRRPPHQVPRGEWLAEIDEELAQRRLVYPRLVAKSAMGKDEAARHIEVLLAIRSDLDGHWDRSASWDAKVRELRRELQLRRNIWPKKIARPADPMTEAIAQRRMERLEAVHFAYWLKLEYHEGDRDLIRELGAERQAWEIEQHQAGNPAARRWLSPQEQIARKAAA